MSGAGEFYVFYIKCNKCKSAPDAPAMPGFGSRIELRNATVTRVDPLKPAGGDRGIRR